MPPWRQPRGKASVNLPQIVWELTKETIHLPWVASRALGVKKDTPFRGRGWTQNLPGR